MYQKTNVNFSKGGVSVNGFGFNHDGQITGLFVQVGQNSFPFFTNNTADKEAIEAFELCFDTGTAPAIGYSRTLNATNVTGSPAQSDWSTLQSQASAGNVDLIATGTIQGQIHGLLYATLAVVNMQRLLDGGGVAVDKKRQFFQAARSPQRQRSQQVRVDPVAFSRQAQFRLRIHGRNAHHFHKPCDPLPIYLETPCCQPRHHSPAPVKRSPRVVFVEQPHQLQVPGRGHDNQNKDTRITGIGLTLQNRADLLAFLQSLTDADLLHDARFGNPW
jgi:hypothetical protein